MGQQQLLLIILGVIIVGIAVAVGITMFQDNAVDQNRSAVISDLTMLAAKAQQYYAKPTTLGGGGNSFTGCSIALIASTAFANNPNGTYTISTAGTDAHIIFQGVGKTEISTGVYPTYTLEVLPSSQAAPVKVN